MPRDIGSDAEAGNAMRRHSQHSSFGNPEFWGLGVFKCMGGWGLDAGFRRPALV